ncbi:M23 family metallopeptidase [Magnetospirillum sulfuroxidans]|nr:M23 family metallopeptidase [Magnetospirillum sulfuroxidans]
MRRLLPLLLLIALPVSATELRGRLEQGGLVLGQAAPGAAISLDGRAVPADAQGHFILGFGRDAAATAILTIDGTSQPLTIARRSWTVQRIDGLPPAKVSPDPELQARIGAENRLIAQAREQASPRALFLSGVTTPAQGIVSGVFGSQRILNGEARAPHSGTDIAAIKGAPVAAIGDGIVTLAHPDMFFTGQTVMIDHGLGLQSVYAHLSRTDVSVGQNVHKGQLIGAVGASGRATGPHLHWGASWLDVRLDPETVLAVLGPNPAGQQ